MIRYLLVNVKAPNFYTLTKIMDRQGTVCCASENTAFEEGLKVGIRLMMEVCRL